MQTLTNAYVEPARQPAPPLALARLREAGIPLVSASEIDLAVGELAEHRRLILGFLEAEHRAWPQ